MTILVLMLTSIIVPPTIIFTPQSVPQSCAPGSRQVFHITQASCLFLIIIIMMIIPNYPPTQPLSFWVTQETPRNVENLLSVHFYFLLTQLEGNSIFFIIIDCIISITHHHYHHHFVSVSPSCPLSAAPTRSSSSTARTSSGGRRCYNQSSPTSPSSSTSPS